MLTVLDAAGYNPVTRQDILDAVESGVCRAVEEMLDPSAVREVFSDALAAGHIPGLSVCARTALQARDIDPADCED